MGKNRAQIQVLDSETIDKIAAGEVVEKPASVVKELVENAIDAGADSIAVEIKDGGLELIRVTDNGSGMEKEQLGLAFMRHATSKIRSAEDLTGVLSLGFRGEALSSIAAVSKTEVITKTPENLIGSRMEIEGGKQICLEDVGAPQGTTFLVRRLFFNTPVRRGFLKQPATEGGYVADLMEHLALSRPDISFQLIINGKTRFHTSGNGELKEVIYRIYGRETAGQLIPIQYEEGDLQLTGYLGKPQLVRSNRNYEIYFINGRFIKSGVIARAIEQGCHAYLMQHKFPFCVLHIHMKAEGVDVNVHPTKMDVRFRDAIAFEKKLTDILLKALKSREMIPDLVMDAPQKEEKQGNGLQEKTHAPQPFETKRNDSYRVMEEEKYPVENTSVVSKARETNAPNSSSIKEKESISISANSSLPSSSDDVFCIDFSDEKQEGSQNVIPDENLKEPSKQTLKNTSEQTLKSISEEAFKGTEEQTKKTDPVFMKKGDQQRKEISTLGEKIPEKSQMTQLSFLEKVTSETEKQKEKFEDRVLTLENRKKYLVIGQVFDTYWLVQFEDKILFVDQHAAHEKVKYERLMAKYRSKIVESQGLMPPVILSLGAAEESVLLQYREVFQNMGFETEPFGGREYALRSVPMDLYGCSARELFMEVLDEFCETNGARDSIRVVEEKIASMSCKAAVKGNHKLDRQEMETLLDELLTLENPYNCPHGRPTMISMSQAELERKFKRIV